MIFNKLSYLFILFSVLACSTQTHHSLLSASRKVASYKNISCQRLVKEATKNSVNITSSLLNSSHYNWNTPLDKINLTIDDVLKYQKQIRHSRNIKEKVRLETEFAVNRNLFNLYNHYKIKVKSMPYIPNRKINIRHQLNLVENSHIHSIKNQDLSANQLQKLKSLYQNAKRYARDTGIGLDISSHNLLWENNHWVLITAAPRLKHRPYDLTLDTINFQRFLLHWNKDKKFKDSHYIKINDFKHSLSKSITTKDLLDYKLKDLILVLKRKINDETGSLSRSQLQALLRSVPKEDYQLALNILHNMTFLSNSQGLAKFIDSLASYFKNYHNTVVLNDGKITSALTYFQGKITKVHMDDNFLSITGELGLEGFVQNRKILIGHSLSESWLSNNKDIILKKNLQLVYISGIEEAISVIDQSSPMKITRKFETIYSGIKNNNIELQSQYEQTINIKRKLKRYGLLNQLNILYYNGKEISETAFPILESHLQEDLSISSIHFRLTPKVISEDAIKKHLHAYSRNEVDQKNLLAAFIPSSQFVSLQQMTIHAKKLYEKILSISQARGIPFENIFYYTLGVNKSYQVATWIFSEVNNIPPSQFYRNYQLHIPESAELVITMDEYSGSGSSLEYMVKTIKEENIREIDIIPAAFYATEFAIDHLTLNNLTPIVAEKIKTMNPKEIKNHMKNIPMNLFNRQGLSSINSTFSMEYMSPDNNNGLFTDFIAPLFTLVKESIKKF